MEKRPALAFGAAVFAGAFSAGMRPWYLTYAVLAGAPACCLIYAVWRMRTQGRFSLRTAAISIIVSVLPAIAYHGCVGVWNARIEDFGAYAGGDIELIIKLSSPVARLGDSLRAEGNPVEIDGGEAVRGGGLTRSKILLSVRIDDEEAPAAAETAGYGSVREKLKYGNVLKVRGRLVKPAPQQNELLFDYQRHLFSKGVAATVYATDDNIELVAAARALNGVPVQPIGAGIALRDRIEDVFRRTLPPKEAALLTAVLAGKTDELENRTRDEFRAAGLLHIMAVSGLHVMIITGLASALLKSLGLGIRANRVITSAILLAFIFMAGFSASVVRAALMYFLAEAARYAGKAYDRLSAIGFAALAILIVNPMQAFDAGFLLSFASVISICLLTPFFRMIPGAAALPRAVAEPALVTLSVGVGCFPVQASLFNSVSTVSVLTNTVSSPLITCVTASGLLTAACGIARPAAAAAPALITLNFIWLLEQIAALAARVPNALVRTGAFSPAFFIVYYTVIASACLYIKKAINMKMAAALIAAALTAAVFASGAGGAFGGLHGGATGAGIRDDEMEVVFLDAGNANAAYINIGNRLNIVVDAAGATGYTDREAPDETRLYNYLSARGVNAVDLAIATHGDADHIGGFRKIFEGLDVRRFVISAVYNGALEELAAFAQTRGAEIIRCGDGDMLYIGGAGSTAIKSSQTNVANGMVSQPGGAGAPVKPTIGSDGVHSAVSGAPVKPMGDAGSVRAVLPGAPDALAVIEIASALQAGADGNMSPPPASVNDESLVAKIVFGDMKTLFCGDVSAAAESGIVSRTPAGGLNAQLMTAPHHGSKYSSGAEFLAAVAPQVAVAHAGKNNYGHPAPETVERYIGAGADFYRTDRDGMVTVICGRDGIKSVKCYNDMDNKLAWQR